METVSTKISWRKKLGWALEALCFALAMSAVIGVTPDDGTEGALLSVLARLRDSFEPVGVEQLICAAALWCALYLAQIKGLRRDIRLSLLAALFAAIYMLDLSVVRLGDSGFVLANGFQRCFGALCMAGLFFALRLGLRWALYFAENTQPERDTAEKSYVKLWAVTAAVIFIFMLPWLFASYPATFCTDSVNQLRQFFGLIPMTAHHPPLSTLIMGAFTALGMRLKSAAFGVFLYVLAQSALMAMAAARAITLMKRMGMGRAGYVASVLFFTLVPLTGLYMQALEKGSLYAPFYLMTLTLTAELIWRRSCTGRQAAALALTAAVSCLLRNNGIYELLPAAVLLVAVLGGKDRKRALASLLALSAIVFGATRIVYPALGIGGGSVAEMLSVPFQQTARYVRDCGDEVTEHEREVIDRVLIYDELAQVYEPTLSDNVKAGYRGDGTALGEYLGVWARMGAKHPKVYLDALLCVSYGYTAPVSPDISLDITYTDGASPVIPEIGLMRTARMGLAVPLNLIEYTGMKLPVLGLIWCAGSYAWLVLGCAVLLWIKKRRAAMVPLLPCILNVGICILSPMCDDLRYCLSTVVAAPMLIYWTAASMRADRDEKA